MTMNAAPMRPAWSLSREKLICSDADGSLMAPSRYERPHRAVWLDLHAAVTKRDAARPHP